MPYRSKKKAKKAAREGMRRLREKRAVQTANEIINPSVILKAEATSFVMDADIENLPQVIKDEILRVSGIYRAVGLAENIRGLQEVAVRRFRGY